jgi:hypothetical protein
VRLAIHGWDLPFEELERFAGALERLELGTDLFRSMEAAQARASRRFRQLHKHEHGGGERGP